MASALSMAAFALAASISPGPVNVLVLGAAVRNGFWAGMRVVTGATVGFTALLVLTGMGLSTVLHAVPQIIAVVRWGGIAFLLYMAWKLWADDGAAVAKDSAGAGLRVGAAMQWVNPKAWLAAVAGMGAFASSGDFGDVWVFSAVYFVVCFASMAAWAVAGAFLSASLANPFRLRLLNRVLAVALLASALALGMPA